MTEQYVFPEWERFLAAPEAVSITKVVKRSGDIVPYEGAKIAQAIGKAIVATEGCPNPDKEASLAAQVESQLRGLLAGARAHSIPAIEEIQDAVETVLLENHEIAIAKAYMLYRLRHQVLREARALNAATPSPAQQEPLPPQRYELFTRRQDEEAGIALARYLDGRALPGLRIDMDGAEGLDQAAEKGVFMSPTVIIYRADGSEWRRSHTLAETQDICPPQA